MKKKFWLEEGTNKFWFIAQQIDKKRETKKSVKKKEIELFIILEYIEFV